MDEAGGSVNKKKRKADEAGGSVNRKKRKADEAGGSVKKKKRKADEAGGSVKKKKRKADEAGGPVKKKKKRKPKTKGRIGPVIIAHAPNLPYRYEYLLKLITFIVPCESPGNAYVCGPNKIKECLELKKCDLGLFFEWFGPDRKMICRMFHGRTHVEFIVNSAFLCVLLRVRVKYVACCFSENFSCDETWKAVKETLEMIFCPPPQYASPEAPAPDHLYVFTKMNDCVYFRNLKINETPASAREDASVLKEIDETPSNACEDAFAFEEVGPNFCLKLVDVYRENDASQGALDISESQIKTGQRLCLTSSVYLSLSPTQLGSSMVHSLWMNGKKFLILLENGQDLSAFEGYNISLREFLEDEPFLKIKYIMGSKTREEQTFIRNVGKLIIRSILANIIEVFSYNKCIDLETKLDYTMILLKGSSVKFYGVKLVKYEEGLAKQNVSQIIQLVRGCFPDHNPPVDVYEMLECLRSNPLQGLQMACDDASILPAKYRREMLIRLHTEYFTNVKPMLIKSGDYKKQCNQFFSDCPYLNNWIRICERNVYLNAVADYNQTIQMLKREKKGQEDNIKEGEEGSRGELQFCIMRNSDVHIPEKVVDDGITPFRLSLCDYIRSAYFPRYLGYIQKRMMKYLEDTKAREEAGKALLEGTP